MNGWLNINKPDGLGSNKVISVLRRILNLKKIGHAGTLDPLADGVLPVAVCEATKTVSYAENARKKYEFLIQFGALSETGDREGEIVDTSQNKVSEEEVIKVIPQFIGKIKQKPHKYSAIKINGKRAYDLARKGEDFEIKEREIEIFSLTLTNFDFEKQQARFIVECSKGTYVRSLGEDIAFSLKNLSFVLELRRLQVGPFKIEESIDFSKILEKDISDARKILESAFHPVDIVLDDILVINISNDSEKLVRFGQIIAINGFDSSDKVILKNEDRLVALGSINEGFFKVKRVFNL